MTQPDADFMLHSGSAEKTVAVGRVVARCCEVGDIIGLDGELGAGKTQFVRGLAEGLGLDPRQVSSPTFVMVQEYEPASLDHAVAEESPSRPSPDPVAPVLVHIDAYRLKNADDLASIGWHDDGGELREGAVVAVEWASLIETMLGPDLLRVQIEHAPEGRRISLSAKGKWRARMEVLREALGKGLSS
ncbi:MAG: tRNA (adenosine(37)-N6)-threonylcarbamoyltransferase complex ATPase subunit type 1 TsaE [Planctomycetota bacterium]